MTIGHLKGWKSKIYVTTVLDSFQDRKGITPKVVNNKQVIGLYSMKYGSNKTKEGTSETRPLPSRVCLSRTVPFLSPCDFHLPVTEATKMSLVCSSFSPLLWHRFFCFFLAQFYWRYPCLRKWVQGVFNWLYKKTMAALFLQAYGPPTKILLLPLVTNMISATSVELGYSASQRAMRAMRVIQASHAGHGSEPCEPSNRFLNPFSWLRGMPLLKNFKHW